MTDQEEAERFDRENRDDYVGVIIIEQTQQ